MQEPVYTQLSDPVPDTVDLTPDDATEFKVTRSIYVGTGGDITVQMMSGKTQTFYNVVGGIEHPYRITKLLATGTTASQIVGLY